MKFLKSFLAGFLAMALIAPVIVLAEDASIEVRADRPRILMTPERLAFLKDKFESDPFPVRDDDPAARALRYLLTGNEDDAAFAIDYMTKFDVPEKVLTDDVASNEYRWSPYVPVIFDWCYDALTDEQKTAFLERFGHIADMMNKKYWGGPHMPGSNYYAGYMRSSAIFGLAAFRESPLASPLLDNALITRWRDSSLPYYASHARGGITGEGTQYDRYNISYVVALAEAVKSATGRDLYRETNWFREWVYQTIYSTSPAEARRIGADDPYYQRFPFGDDQFNQGHPDVGPAIADSMRALVREFADEKTGAHAAEYLEIVEPPIGLLGYVVEDERPVEPGDLRALPLDFFASGARYAYLKSSWRENATAIMLQLGIPSGGSHLHQDLGSFQMMRGSSWLTKESTGYGHKFKGTDASGAMAHNTLLFNHRGPVPGHPDGPPKLRALESHEKFFHAVVGMTAAYRAQESPKPDRDDNPAAGMCVREFLFIRPDVLIIFDRMSSTSPDVPKTFVLHFPERPKSEDDNLFTLESGGSQFTAQFVYPQKLGLNLIDEGDVEGKKENEPAWYQWRLEATQTGSSQSQFLTVLGALERFDAPPRCELEETEDTLVLAVNQPGRRCIITFNKALSDNFGHLTIHAAGAHGHIERDLLEGVQPFSVDADGPNWGAFQADR